MYRISKDLKKYNFPGLIENESFKKHISGIFSADRAPGAILICGEDGCGRNFAARLLAADYLDDTAGLVLRGIHPDLLTVSGSGTSGQITIESIREVSYECNKAAVMADNKRVVLIRDAFNLNTASANALLKTLEQPPEGVLFIITSRREHDLIPTVLSRCMVSHVQPVSPAAAYDHLAGKFPGVEPSQLRHVCTALRGHIGLITKTLSDQHTFLLFRESELALNDVMQGNKLGFGAHISAAENRADLKQMIFFMYSAAASSPADYVSVTYFLEALAKAYADADQNINIQLLSSFLTAQIQE